MSESARSSHPEIVQAKVLAVQFYAPEKNWGVVIAKSPDSSDRFTAAGNLMDTPYAGQSLRLNGVFTEHPKYGAQFRIDSAVALQPTTHTEMIKYFCRGEFKGVGEVTAKMIVDHFGLSVLDVLAEDSSKVLEVKGIPKKIRTKLVDMFSEVLSHHHTKTFLATHGFTSAFVKRIVECYGDTAVEVLSQNPYLLIYDVAGIGFIKADIFAKSLGFAVDSLQRLQGGLLYCLTLAEDDGHCYLTESQIVERMSEILGLQPQVVQNSMIAVRMDLCERRRLVLTTGPQGDLVYYSARNYRAETAVVDKIRSLGSFRLSVDGTQVDMWIREFSSKNSIELSNQQLDAVKSAVMAPVFILTGGPGVGKTTTANAIIYVAKAMGRAVSLCAPTGRAAQRLSEVSGQPAQTIHRTLKWDPAAGGFKFGMFGETLSANTVIVDEASMLDITLAGNLFSAVADGSQLILIGDVDQLPSVGPGCVLRDLIDSGQVPFVHLKEVFRQAAESNIIRTSHALNQGVIPDLGLETDCKLIECKDALAIQSAIVTLVTSTIPAKTGLDPHGQIQVLTPMNRGPLGADELNLKIRSELFSKRGMSLRIDGSDVFFLQGDKVIQTQNNYELKVFNGEIGQVVHSDSRERKITVGFGDRQVEYGADSIRDLKFAYAITIHKSQGSEFPCVLIPLSFSHRIMLQRNLIYTGLTRARKLAVFVGDKRALRFAAENQTASSRQTMVVERLRDPT